MQKDVDLCAKTLTSELHLINSAKPCLQQIQVLVAHLQCLTHTMEASLEWVCRHVVVIVGIGVHKILVLSRKRVRCYTVLLLDVVHVSVPFAVLQEKRQIVTKEKIVVENHIEEENLHTSLLFLHSASATVIFSVLLRTPPKLASMRSISKNRFETKIVSQITICSTINQTCVDPLIHPGTGSSWRALGTSASQEAGFASSIVIFLCKHF